MLECEKFTTLVCREMNSNMWVSSSHSSDWSWESLLVLCLELHEPKVVLHARFVYSPLPQRECRHQYPQWLLRALKHPTVTTLTPECTHCASFSTWKYQCESDRGHFKRSQRNRVEVLCVVDEHHCHPETSSVFFICADFVDDSATLQTNPAWFYMILDRFYSRTLSLP